MSLFSRVIKSFRKLFQFKKSSPRKSKPSKPSRKKLLKTKISRKSVSKPAVKKTVEKPKKPVKISKIKAKPEAKIDVKKSKPAEEPKGKWVGDITHYFNRIQVIVLEIKNGSLKSGDKILIKGAKTNFIQPVKSMQIESIEVKTAKKGQIIGLKVEKDAQVGDKVFLLS